MKSLNKDDYSTLTPLTWNHVCESVALLAVLVIAIDFVLLVLGWPRIPYSDGAAVVVAVGAVLGQNCYSLVSRCFVAVVLLGLVSLRLCSAIFPDYLIATHGTISTVDFTILISLVVLCSIVAISAFIAQNTPNRFDSSIEANVS
jgi:hypothetical protein